MNDALVKTGDVAKAAPVAALGRLANRLGARRASAVASNTAGGYSVALGGSGVDARLSGTASPYDWQEVYGTTGGGWSVLPGGRSGTAHEKNAAAGLDNKVARVSWDEAAGEWRFLWRRQHGTGAGTCDVTITVLGCGAAPVAGASVTLGAYGTRTTNSGGQVTFTGVSAGSPALGVTASGYANYSSTFAFTCPSVGTTVTLTPTSSNPCLANCGTASSCLFPSSVTFQVTDACAYAVPPLGGGGFCSSGTFIGVTGPTTVTASYLSSGPTSVTYHALFTITLSFAGGAPTSLTRDVELRIQFTCTSPTTINCTWTVASHYPTGQCNVGGNSGGLGSTSTCAAFLFSGQATTGGSPCVGGGRPTYTVSR